MPLNIVDFWCPHTPFTRRLLRYLTEIDAGRWHPGLRAFELRSSLAAVVAAVLGEETALRFFMDHCFLKEAGSGRE